MMRASEISYSAVLVWMKDCETQIGSLGVETMCLSCQVLSSAHLNSSNARGGSFEGEYFSLSRVEHLKTRTHDLSY